MSNKQQSLWQQGQRHTERRQWRQAIAAYEAIVDHDRSFVPAWLELCSAYEQLDAYRDAKRAVLSAAQTSQLPPMMALAVARRLRQFEAIDELEHYVDATRLAAALPPEKLLDLIVSFASAGYHQYSEAWIEHVLKLHPKLAEAHNTHALTLMFAGRMEESAAAFERAISYRPGYSAAYAILSRVTKVKPDCHHVDELRALLARPNLAAKDEINYAHALHNELHELGEFDAAWQALDRANRLRRPLQAYDHASMLKIFDRLRAIFDHDFVQGSALDESLDRLEPIFIVGLHRSGTTLLERILSGHPDIADAGETYTFTAQLRIAADHFCRPVVDFELIDRASEFDYGQIGRGFLSGIRGRSRGKRFITEKMNPNFILLGPIAKALPHAKLLHMRRDPIDTCFSNLRTLFTHEGSYSYDQLEMADYFNIYQGIMQHWRAVLPGRLLDVDYDALVNDADATATGVAEYCGFDFQPEMLQVERQVGMVTTASSSQVRQGILKNRGGLWRAYESHLGPMIDRLATHGLL
jgi:tetratricopeptide (TPR) repeat protein